MLAHTDDRTDSNDCARFMASLRRRLGRRIDTVPFLDTFSFALRSPGGTPGVPRSAAYYLRAFGRSGNPVNGGVINFVHFATLSPSQGLNASD